MIRLLFQEMGHAQQHQYMLLLQITDAIRKDTSTDLVGYVPEKQLSDSEIKDAIKTAGCKSITKQKEALKMYGKYIEQEVSIILYSTINIKIIDFIWG